ncbi:MAG: 5'-nucleotidase C-terminal domain-containing protein [Cyanobacteria bacterium]|nr:5'-nucleotidase C-terminal domain-containing protein [Cyanobacteriota bacterium]
MNFPSAPCKGTHSLNSLKFKSSSPQPLQGKYRAIYIGDIHQSYLAAARCKTLIDNLAEEGRNQGRMVTKTFVGDMHTGQKPTRWLLNLKIMEQFGFDLKVFGNHESYIPPKDLVEGIESENVKPFHMSNLKKIMTAGYQRLLAAGKILTKPLTLEKEATSIGIIGVTGPIEKKPLRKHSFALSNDRTYKIIQNQAEALKLQKDQPVMLASHYGDPWDCKLAQTPVAKSLDVILGGHSHKPIEGIQPGVNLFTKADGRQIIVTNAGAFGEFVGCLDFDYDANGPHFIANRLIPTNPSIPRSPEIEALIQKEFPDLKTITTVQPGLSLERHLEKKKQMWFLADASRKAGNTPIGLVRSNEYRNPLNQDVSKIELEISLPYAEHLVKVHYTGLELKQALEKSAQPNAWPWLMSAGLRYQQQDASQPIQNIEVEVSPGVWEPLNEDKEYPVSLCSYIVTAEKAFPSLNKSERMTQVTDYPMSEVMGRALANTDQAAFSFTPLATEMASLWERQAE